ncbi:glycosidase [Candidatus Woesearchaeota archaeon]|nr:glycosidase [Candidatus Woesearchaeota archaeon]
MVFKRYQNNPIIKPDPNREYEKNFTYNPCAIVHNNEIYLIYRAEGDSDVSTLCLATSNDGYNFTKYNLNPIIKPTIPEEKGGCEDPRIIKIDNTFYLTFTAYNGMQPVTSATINTAFAVSNDLFNWEKKGILVKGIKAATIFSEKINEKYLMLIGGEYIKLGWSSDLFNWEIEDKPILDVREGKFDDRYVEVGPQPLVFQDKLVLFFNTADKQGVFHPSLAILDKKDPHRVIYRADTPLMTPAQDYELKGKVKNVIFGTGLVEFNSQYFYYYGAADKYVCLATIEKDILEEYLTGLIS